MQTILITGGSGFLGSKLATDFQQKGWRVILALRNGYLPDKLVDVINKDNINVVEVVNGVIKESSDIRADVVIHAATCYGRSGESWAQIAEANIALPLGILTQVEKIGFKLFVNFDTFFNEKMVFEGNEAIYVRTKQIFSDIMASVSGSTAAKYANLKLEQVYGPGDNEKKFIPQIIRLLNSGSESIKLTKGEQKRDWVYVDDVVASVQTVVSNIDKLGQYEEFGIGAGESFSIKEIVEYLKKITGSQSELHFGELSYRIGEIFDSKANSANINRLGWRPIVDWHSGLEKTVLYYKEKK
jgi:CDP-paratose synthetase